MYSKEKWEKAVDFHGHICPGLSMGFKAAEEALAVLEKDRSKDEEIVAIVENDACGVDGVQVLTGCTIGKGNLIFKDFGKQAFSFVVRVTGEGVRVILKPQALHNEEHQSLRGKVMSGQANEEEKSRFKKIHQELSYKLLEEDFDNNFEMSKIKVSLPEKARIFSTVKCDFCQEGVMEPRARVKNGKIACLECADGHDSRFYSLG